MSTMAMTIPELGPDQAEALVPSQQLGHRSPYMIIQKPLSAVRIPTEFPAEPLSECAVVLGSEQLQSQILSSRLDLR